VLRRALSAHAAPWKRRFRAATAWGRTAPGAPGRGLAIGKWSGSYQLHAWEVATGQLRQLTDRPHGTFFGLLSPDGRFVYYLDDPRGSGLGHFVRVPFEGGAPEDLTPGLPPYAGPPYAATNLAVGRASSRLALAVTDARGSSLYVLDAGERDRVEEPRPVYRTTGRLAGLALSATGDLLVAASTGGPDELRFGLVCVEPDGGTVVAEMREEGAASVLPHAFSPRAGDARLVATSDRSGYRRAFLWHPRTGEREELDVPGLEGDVVPLDWSDDGGHLLLLQTYRAVQRLHVHDLAAGATRALDQAGGTFGMGYFRPRGEVWTAWQDATHPGRIVAVDAASGARLRDVLDAGAVPAGRPWRSVTFASSDGAEVQAWLATPEGSGPFATVVEAHGGPHRCVTEEFWPWGQAWTDHGFAFLTVNYRGSTGFGRAFMEQIWGDLGHWEVEDLVGARAWLVSEGIADPGRVLLTGFSYGGYLTLQALGRYPELWAAGIAGLAVADLAGVYRHGSDAIRSWLHSVMRGSPEEQPRRYAAGSPITYVEQVRAPVFIVQGRHDTTTPPEPVAAYAERLRALGRDVELHWYDSGHLGPFADPERSIEHQERMLAFAYRVLRGR
jgi:dipeptidyl aminopeptidase/acylaminoacyl peptidase